MKNIIKRSMSLFLTCILVVTVFLINGSAKMVRSGDVNGDGNISAADARTALRISAQLESADEFMCKFADVDGNGSVSASDARTILRAAASLEDSDKFAEFDDGAVSGNEMTVIELYTYETVLYEGEKGIFEVSSIDTPENFLWTTTDSSVATVSDEGVITAHKKGYTCIVAYYDGDMYYWNIWVRNDFQKKIYALQNKYPGGYFWNNHTPSEEYPEVSEIPCDDHADKKWAYCKGQCAGFSTLMFNEVHGKNMYTYGKKGVTWDTVKIGDYVRLAKNHSIFVTDVINEGDPIGYSPYWDEMYYAEQKMIVVVHCNWGWCCDIVWDDVFTPAYDIASEYSYTI